MHSSSYEPSPTLSPAALGLRALQPADRAPIEAILRATGVFREAEIEIALELVDAKPEAGYQFLVAEVAGIQTGPGVSAENGREVAGYACFGSTPLTDGTFDLYWIAVDPRRQGQGIGRRLMIAAENRIRALGGRLMLIETASKPAYDPTRAFYLAYGCREVARVPDFYALGDDKVIYARDLA